MSRMPRLFRDAYFTRAEWLVELGLNHVALPPGRVWEPACGAGHLCRALAARGRDVVASDIYDWGWPCQVQDFFSYDVAPAGVTAILTNPPFRRGVALPFVRHALRLMAPVGGTVAMLLAHDWITARDRADLFDRWGPFDRVIVPTARPLWFDPAAPVVDAAPRKSKRPIKTYCWYVWSPAGVGRHGHVQVVPVGAAGIATDAAWVAV
ncbi:hypothetical protein [Niveispirillum fermenti]|uniref:hypothetical protein n=1 Tax=Niveispirillum fermenti TaxID=1233113 RepID=UPI003A882E26